MASFSAAEYTTWVQQDLKMQLDPRLQVFDTANEDNQIERGIRTTSTINAHSTLAIVPFGSLLTVESPVSDAGFDALRHQLSEDDMLVLLLLHEKHKGSESKWFPHFAVIPSVYHSIANYSEDDLELIKGSNLYDLAYRWKDQLQQDFIDLLSTLQASQFDFTAIIGEELTYEKYLWGLSTVWSRCITISARNGRDFRCVTPFVDLLNHHPASQVGHAYNAETDALYLVTNQELPAGQEISLHYGPCANSRLLMLYGFTLSSNPYDNVELFASIAEEDEERVQLLKQLQLPFNAQPFRLLLSDTDCDAERQLLMFLRVLHAEPMQLQTLRAVITSLPTVRAWQVTLSPENETASLRGAISAVKDMLDGYRSTLAEDLLQLRRIGAIGGGFVHPAQHQLHALHLVLGEKKVLHKVLKRFEAKLNRHLQEIGEAAQESG